MHKSKLTKERIYIEHPEFYGQDMINRHIDRYEWALSKLNKEDEVLELCCGSGYGSHMIAQNCKSVIAVDKSKEAIEYAENHYKLDNLKYRVLDLDYGAPVINEDIKLYFNDMEINEILEHNNLDNPDIHRTDINTIIWIEGIEHFSKKRTEFLLNFYQPYIRNNGNLIISTPDKEQSDGKNEYHVKEYTAYELKSLISKYFKVTDIKIEGKFIYLVAKKNG